MQREAEERRLALKYKEPVTHLFLGGEPSGTVVHVILPVRAAKAIGAADMTTFRQFQDGIKSRAPSFRYELEPIDVRGDYEGVIWWPREDIDGALYGTGGYTHTRAAAVPSDVVAEQEGDEAVIPENGEQ